jgi:hypothetical protein
VIEDRGHKVLQIPVVLAHNLVVRALVGEELVDHQDRVLRALVLGFGQRAGQRG